MDAEHYDGSLVLAGPYKSSGGPMKFDFGTPSSPVQPGYTRVAPNKFYSAATGYSCENISVDSRAHGAPLSASGEESLERDFCLVGAGNAYYGDIPNGKFRLSAIVGDTISETGITLRADGVPIFPGRGASANRWAKVSVFFESGMETVFSARVGSFELRLPIQKSGHIHFEFIASDTTVASFGILPFAGPYPTSIHTVSPRKECSMPSSIASSPVTIYS